MESAPLLNFNSNDQEFSFNSQRIEKLDFRAMADEQLFNPEQC